MNTHPISFAPQDLASAAKAAHRYGFVEHAFDAMRSYESAKDLLDAWASLEGLQKQLDFYFHGRPNEEPEIVTQARRAFFRGLCQELGA